VNYEVKLLNAVLESGDYIECQSENVGSVFINYKDIWAFITKHYNDHGKIPAKAEIKSHFPDFEYLSTTEPLSYYIDEARKESMSTLTRELMLNTHEMMKNSGPKTALNYLVSNANQLVKDATNLKDTDISGEWRERLDELKKRAESDDGGTIGIPTGISVIDAEFGGWQPGDFIVLLGWTGVGKSFIARLFAVNAWLAGYRPMIISLEMSKQQEAQRIDTLLNNGRGYFTHSDLVRPNSEIVDSYQEWGESQFNDMQPFYLITSDGLDVADQNLVQAKIDQYKPDMVILDYHGLFDDASGAKSETEKAKNLSKAFKRMAVKNNVPIIDVAAVTMNDGHSERPPELEEVAWSKQLAYDADLVLALHREMDSSIFQVVSRKVRRCTHFGFFLNWNLDTGEWKEEWGV
jgi:replicative DNA helicase|tara:strand:- start:1290 stop:2507 length:1218 start_codon:yes stop_codon:yes gene_type:complete